VLVLFRSIARPCAYDKGDGFAPAIGKLRYNKIMMTTTYLPKTSIQRGGLAMDNLILNSLEMRRFRAFEHLKIERLGRVNLIVGENAA
jgi:hypothetical protein